MRVIEVVAVRPAESRVDLLQGHALDRPGTGAQVDGESLEIAGWALGCGVPVVAVEVLHGNEVLRRTPVEIYRPDVVAAFPGAPGASQSGFRTRVAVPGARQELTLGLRAVLADGRRAPLAALELRWHWWEAASPAPLPAVSVIIACSGRAHLLAESIESALCQTRPGAEILVLDDGALDNVAAVAARYPGVRCLRQERPGLAEARNAGIRHSSGSALLFLDAGDRLLPHALETGLEALAAHPEAGFVYGHTRAIAFDGAPLPSSALAPAEGDPYTALLRGRHIGAPAAVMYRRAALRAAGGLDPAAGACADQELYLRLARQTPVVGHGKVVAEARQRGADQARALAPLLRAQLAVLRRQLPYVQGSPAYRDAYRSGLRRARIDLGEPLAEEVRALLRRGAWAELLPDLFALACCHPWALVALLLGSLRPPAGPSLLWLARAARQRRRRAG